MHYEGGCGQCGKEATLCWDCHRCKHHCHCGSFAGLFDADELGLDPETDNTPEDPTRHA